MKSNVIAAHDKLDLVRGGAGVFALRISAAAIGFLNGVVLARLLGLEAYGIFSQVVAAATTIAGFLGLGMPSLLTRELATYLVGERWPLIKGIVHWAFRNVLITCFGVSLVSLFVVFAYAPEGWRTPSIFGVGIAILLTLNLLRAAVLRGFHQVVVADLPDSLVQPLAILGLIGLSVALARQFSVVWAVTLQFAGTLSAFLLGLLIFWKFWPQPCGGVSPVERPDQWRFPAGIFLLIGALSISDNQLAILLTGRLAGSAQAGLLQGANRFVALIAFGLAAVNSPLMPKLAAAWSRGNRQESQALVTATMRIGLTVALLIATPLLLFPQWFLSWFGVEFAQASTAMRILAIAQIFNAASGPCGLVLLTTGHQSKALLALAAAITANVLTSLWLTADWGVLGAAIAVAVSLATWNLLMSYWAWRHTKIMTMAIRGGR